MRVRCKHCHAEIPNEDINVAKAICHCRPCNEVFKLADFLLDSDTVTRIEKPHYSKIESFLDDTSMGFIIPNASQKGTTIFFLIFTIIWNGISWPLFFSSLSEEDLFAKLFMLPFVIVGVITFLLFLFSWKGLFSLLIDQNDCYAVWSLFQLKYRRRIATSQISTVVEDVVYHQNYQPVYGVGIKHGKNKTLKFGSGLTEEERKWCIGEIRHFLAL